MITFDDFKKLEIKIGRVVSAEKIPDTDKLLIILFDVGNGEQRQIIAGIAAAFPDSSVLVGKEMPILVNLEPREIRGYTSEGMILAADDHGEPVPLHPARELPPGSLVR